LKWAMLYASRRPTHKCIDLYRKCHYIYSSLSKWSQHALSPNPSQGDEQWPRLRLPIADSTISNEALADAIGNADAVLKGAEAECKALKDEFKSRGLLTAGGERFTVTRSDQISSRLDVAAVKAFLGDAWRKFETASITTVIRIKAAQQLAAAA
jgi:hypothetical protein